MRNKTVPIVTLHVFVAWQACVCAAREACRKAAQLSERLRRMRSDKQGQLQRA
eukprot:m.45534 g.45534  ORF g.45534 m.45534 type:complete len:53 (+) comp33618_c0_seq3:116-274(+)